MMRSDKVLKSFLNSVKKKFGSHLERIILFGSKARGKDTSESDYDLLFIFDEVTKEKLDFVEDLASEILYEQGKLISTFLLTEEQLQEMRFEPFIMNVQKEGVLL